MIVVSTLFNVSGTRLLARVAMFGFICELIGAIVVGCYLLIFARHHPISALFDTFGLGHRPRLPAGIPGVVAVGTVLLLRFRGLRRCGRGDAEREPHDSARHAHDHLCRRRRRHVGLPGD